MKNLIDLSENVIRIQPLGSDGWATAFLICYEEQKYWITAKHVFEGKDKNKVNVFVSKNEKIELSIMNIKISENTDIMLFQTG
jgi:hypothetical protein